MSDPTIFWTALGVIAAIFFGGLGTLFSWQTKREARYSAQNQEIKEEIKTAVEHLGEVLTAKMETKDTVNGISVRLARLEGAMGQTNDNSNRQ